MITKSKTIFYIIKKWQYEYNLFNKINRDIYFLRSFDKFFNEPCSAITNPKVILKLKKRYDLKLEDFEKYLILL